MTKQNRAGLSDVILNHTSMIDELLEVSFNPTENRDITVFLKLRENQRHRY